MKPDEIPDTESLATTLDRVLPFWESEIVADIKAGKKVLVRTFGTVGIALYWPRPVDESIEPSCVELSSVVFRKD